MGGVASGTAGKRYDYDIKAPDTFIFHSVQILLLCVEGDGAKSPSGQHTNPTVHFFLICVWSEPFH